MFILDIFTYSEHFFFKKSFVPISITLCFEVLADTKNVK